MNKNSMERTLLVCCGTDCIASGALEVARALERTAKAAEKKRFP